MGYFETARDLGASSYWKLDETSGTYADSIGAVAGTVVGGVTRGYTPPAIYPWTPGVGAADLNGSTGRITFGDNYDFGGTASFSVAGWIYFDVLSGTPRIFNKTSGGLGWEIIAVAASSQIAFRRIDGTGADSAGNLVQLVETGAWYHFACTFDGTTMYVYVNAVAGASAAATRSLPGNALNLTLGSNASAATNLVDGKVDEVAIWDGRALTATEVLALYNSSGRGAAAPSIETRIGWRPEQFNRVTNSGFETDTSGWSVSAGINGAATSITRITTDFHTASASASLVCPATALTGANFDFGSDSFFSVSTYKSVYRAVLWAKSVSGTTKARLIFGSEGTASDRASKDITLTTAWQPFYVDWAPSATRTDVQLAIVNIPAVAMTARIDDVAVYLRNALTQVSNGYFTTDSGGWVTTAGINAAGSSLTRVTISGYYGGTSGQLVTTATNGSGMNFDLGTAKFTAGRTYRLRAWLRSVSGTSARIRLGSLGTAADRGSSIVALTALWAAYTVDWTPAADQTDVEVAITNGSATAVTLDVTGVEVYEALDDISSDFFGLNGGSAIEFGRGANFDNSGQQSGYCNLTVVNAMTNGKYTPEYTSGSLYGLLRAGPRVLVRANWAASPYALFYGAVKRFVPQPLDLTCQILCEEIDFGRVSYHAAHGTGTSYHDARVLALTTNTIYAYSSESGPIESLMTYKGTDATTAEDYFAEFDKATGSIHFQKPQVYASDPYAVVFRGRTVHSDATTPSEVWDDDLSDSSGYDVTEEAVVNRQRVGVSAYERGSFNQYVWAAQPEKHSLIDDPDGKFYAGDEGFSGTFPTDEMPLTVAANTTRVLRFSFSPDLASPLFSVTYTSGSATEVTDAGADFATLTLTAGSADAVIEAIYLFGYPLWPLPINDADESDAESIWLDGEHAGSDISSDYIPHPAYASGLGQWKVWRYRRSRARPSAMKHNVFWSQLGREVGDRVTLNFARMNVASKVFVILGFSTSVSVGSRDWKTTYQLEELPAQSSTWFKLGTSALDGAHVLAY